MLINSDLFSKGIPLIAGEGLSGVLEGRRRRIVEEIRNIADLDDLTDSFLEQLVENSLVEPIVMQFDQMTSQTYDLRRSAGR